LYRRGIAAIEAQGKAIKTTSTFYKFVIAALIALLGLSAAILAEVQDAPVPPTTSSTVPPSSGFPSAANTGPTGTLAPSGSISTTANGQVIQNLDISGSVQVRHNNVTIRNVRIRSAGQAISINGNTGLVVEDCELDGLNASPDAAIAEHNYTMRRCEILRHGEGPRINGNVTLEDNYMHTFANWIASAAHQDGVQTTSGSNIVIRHNTILIDVDGANAAVFFGTFGGSNIVVERNLLSGASFTLRVGSNYTGVTVKDNQFAIMYNPSDDGSPSSGWYGALQLQGQVNHSGSTWYDGPNKGKPVTH
jgi:hypothetical protein